MEKPIDILFNLGANDNDPRTPKILPTSIMKIGQLGILAAPGEFTVMAGRRAKATVAENTNIGIQHIVFAGYSDAYAGYVTTREEYASQQYEGASTHFGPWTLAAYRQEFERLALVLENSNNNPWSETEPTPPQKSYLGGDKTVHIFFDDKPLFKSFGSVYENTNSSYNSGDTAQVIFWGAHPNNDTKTNDTYLKVQKKNGSSWETKYEDRDFNTKLIWQRDGVANSKVTVQWKIKPDTESGYYRIVHSGKWKNGWNGSINPYTGVSKTFYVNGTSSRIQGKDKEKTILNVNLFPNPSNGSFTLINDTRLLGKYSISNTLGQIVQKGNISKERYNTLNLKGSNGVYLLKVIYENQSIYTSTLVKK